MIFTVTAHDLDDAKNTIVKMRCPSCRQRGTFDVLVPMDVKLHTNANHYIILGQRRCPDPACKAHVFFALDRMRQQLVAAYPAERIDFDTTDVPASVVSALEEAITCHSNQCYTAAAIMVRKTLEELCRERGAKGLNLKKRIEELRNKVVLPQELLEGMDNLRLLGNDAAHIESQEFNEVGQEEVEVGIEITKEVLKAVYQYTSLINRLQKMKKPAAIT